MPSDYQHAVAVDATPPGTRLLLLLLAFQDLVAAVEERRRVRRRCDELLREAMAYRSAPEQEMDDRLDATRLLLLEQGFIPRGLRGPLAPEELTDLEEADAPPGVPRDATRAHVANALAREVKLTLHPDLAGDAPLALGEDEIAEAIARAKTAERLGDPELAYEVLLETLPKYHVQRARQRIEAGIPLDQIALDEPTIVSELSRLRWVTMQPGRRVADLPYPNLNLAKTEAARLQKEAERLTLAHAFALAYAAAEDVIRYRKTLPTDETALETLVEVLNEMASVGHDLWVTEATAEESVNANVLVKRLHSGVGREVRDLGNAVYHLAKVLAPDTVYAESVATAAATLRRAVAWVDNSLTQFKMELHAAGQRMRLPTEPEVRRSSISGLATGSRY
jgi:hypothetical protein